MPNEQSPKRFKGIIHERKDSPEKTKRKASMQNSVPDNNALNFICVPGFVLPKLA